MMLVHYKFRYLYALVTVLSIFVGGYQILLNKDWSQLTTLKNRMQQLETLRRWEKQHVLQNKKSLIATKGDHLMMLATIQKMLQAASLSIEDLQIVLAPSMFKNAVIVQLTLFGNFNQFVTFINAMKTSETKVIVTDFNMRVKEQQQLLLEVKLLLFSNEPGEPKTFSTINTKAQPFCDSNSPILQAQKIPITEYHLDQIKLIGVFLKSDVQEALLEFPDTTIVALQPGERAGKEKAQLWQVTPSYVLWKPPNQPTQRMWMQSYAH